MMSDTCTTQAGEVMQIPSNLWRGWVFRETGSLWGKPEKNKPPLHELLIHSLSPHCEALPDLGAVNAFDLFLDPASVPAYIFSYINYPNVLPMSNVVQKIKQITDFHN